MARAFADTGILTIGHSHHAMEHFLDLLSRHEVQVVADVRSHPYSKFASQFDREPLIEVLRAAGFRYVYLGAELGGRPRGDAFYDRDGRVLYDRVAMSPVFRDGLARLKSGIQRQAVTLLCAEEDPAGCHRRLLVGRVLTDGGIAVAHIRGDGRLQTEQELRSAETHDQMELFEEMEAAPWKSIPSVSQKRRQSSSSAF